MKRLLLLLLLIVSTQIQASQLERYSNARFGFSAGYPANLFTNARESDNGDGITLTNDSRGLKVLFYGSLAVVNDNIRDEYRSSIGYIEDDSEKEITYKVLKRNWYLLSGYDYKQRKIFYQKTFLVDGDKFITYHIEYPIKDKKRYNKLIKTVDRNFRP
ncbi:hypothetical protein MNB_SV-6-1262 [hydrothermal vent metagenome]|uniref:Uncharacterized protein n=1 Tax=hydrothermal vent metagenome TaxID=652676 RepID=A0A1W1BDS9_9ZZZZ